MKIALVHDDLIQFGGAEKLLLAIHEIWPKAPVFTSIYDKRLAISDKRFATCEIRTSWMQKLPFKKALRRVYFPLYPAAFESFDFSQFDVVLSSSTRFAHGVITKPNTVHICYSNSPTRFLWETKKYLEYENIPNLGKILLNPILSFLRIWDLVAARRPDFWVANSVNVAAKLKKFYRVDSTVIYPFVDLKRFKPKTLNLKPGTFFLVVSRLVAWKRIDIAVEAAKRLKFPLKIVGTGPAAASLKKIAKNKVEFLGEVRDADLVGLYSGCWALILPQEEDFGINALEVQAAGKPVIAYGAGGVLETVISAKTGVFFEEQTVESLIAALKKFDKLKINPKDCFENAKKFSKENFQKNLNRFVEAKYQQFALRN